MYAVTEVHAEDADETGPLNEILYSTVKVNLREDFGSAESD